MSVYAVSISSLEDRRAASELKVRQYLACGKPVVISPGGNEFVAHEGLGSVVDPSDPEAIAAIAGACWIVERKQPGFDLINGEAGNGTGKFSGKSDPFAGVGVFRGRPTHGATT